VNFTKLNTPVATVLPCTQMQKQTKEFVPSHISVRSMQYQHSARDRCSSSSHDSDVCVDDSDADPDYTDTEDNASSSCESEISSDEQISSKQSTKASVSKAMTLVTDKSRSGVTEHSLSADQSCTVTNVASDDEMQVEEAEVQPCAVTVARSSGTKTFDKKPYCYYCGIAQSQVQRHWFSKHPSETEVIEISMCKDKMRRNQLIARLRNIGNHSHNVEVIRQGKGEIMVTHRKSETVQASEYVPCDRCYSYVRKRDLWRHKCKFGKSVKGRKAGQAQLLLPAPDGMSRQVFELLSYMKDDDIKSVAKCDSMILEYCRKLIQSKGMQKRGYIKDKVREIARFLIQVRQSSGVNTLCLKDCINPEQFTVCVSAVKVLTGFDENTASYRTPSLALKIGHALKKIANVVKRQAIESREYEKIRDIDYFSDLCCGEWGEEIAKCALDTLNHRKRNKVNLLPIAADVQKLVCYLRQTSSECMSNLRKAVDDGCMDKIPLLHRELAEVTLADIIIFNRRRQGEVAKLIIDDYNKKTKVDMGSDVQAGLSLMEQKLCGLFCRVEIRGKRDRVVPILLTEHIQSAVDLLNQYRSDAGIYKSNKYVFAVAFSDNFLRGSDVLRKVSVQCGASQPSTLTSTNLRKHVATVSQILNLKDHELDTLAQFLGHDIRVHRHFYRLPNDVVQTSQLAKIFMLMETGELTKHKGKSLDELMVSITDDTGVVS